MIWSQRPVYHTDSFKTWISITKLSTYGSLSTLGAACPPCEPLCSNKQPLCLIGLCTTQLRRLPPSLVYHAPGVMKVGGGGGAREGVKYLRPIYKNPIGNKVLCVNWEQQLFLAGEKKRDADGGSWGRLTSSDWLLCGQNVPPAVLCVMWLNYITSSHGFDGLL